MSTRDGRRSNARSSRRPQYGLARYWEATQEPLYCLLFLLPLVVAYEFGALMIRTTSGGSRLLADWLLQRALALFGASPAWLPGLALLLTLLVWHVLSGRRWRVHLVYFPLMLIESVALTVPLYVATQLAMQATASMQAVLGVSAALVAQAALAAPSALTAQTALATPSGAWLSDPVVQSKVVHGLGAGVFEELLFRLYLITGLEFVLRDALRLARPYAVAIAILLASCAFAAAHFLPIGGLEWQWTAAVTKLLGGLYLSLVFVGRGLGVATGCHAAFNLSLLFLNHPS